MKHLRLSIVGFGTVGRWLADAVHRRGAWLERECGVTVSVVSVATRRGGFIHRDDGIEIPALLKLLAAGNSLTDYLGVQWWENALEGLTETEYDVMAEASNTNPRDPEPALSHLRKALEHGAHVITSSKGACAAAALELMALAKKHGVRFRMESTVMSGTPILSTLREGLAGTRVVGIRGILNGTANHILSLMADGLDYPHALADAQAHGYAEPDPTDDVVGHDVVAKVRILAAAAFGRTISADQVIQRGITGITQEEVHRAALDKCRIKLVASIEPRHGSKSSGAESVPLECRVEPIALPLTDPLSRIDGVMNALTFKTDTVHKVTVIGPGAGPEQAWQGIFSDLVATSRAC
jgi:homoserine dehydrogenase